MNILVRPNGQRDRRYRPYIDQEETTRSIVLWNPYEPYHYGLYDSSRPDCGQWQNYFNSNRQSFAVNVGMEKDQRFIQPWSYNQTGKLYSAANGRRGSFGLPPV